MAKYKFGVIFLYLFFAVISLYAQNSEQKPAWYSSFFIEGAIHYHFSPDPLSGAISPNLGFRGALGYEWDKLRLFASSGYSSSEGTDPLVTSFSFIPMTIGAGYMLPLSEDEKWGAQADLGLGVQLLRTSHYETWLDLAGERPLEAAETKLFAEGRLYATYTPLKFLRIFAGGGVDMVFEPSKPVLFPVLEAGVSFKPLLSLPQRKPKTEGPVFVQPGPKVEEPFENPPNQIDMFRYVVYFQPNSGTEIVEPYRPALNEVGKRMQTYPEMRLVLRGYAAPFDTEGGQLTISAARVWYCTEYLKREYGIPEERIRMAFFGSDETSPPEGPGFNARRRVEMFSEPLESSLTEEPLLRPSVVIRDDPNWVVPVQHKVYFEAESGTEMLDPYLPQLRSAGQLLQADPETRLTLLGYAAPVGTRDGQITRSAARIWSCVEFLKREYGIAEDRIRMAFFGAEGVSVAEGEELNPHRRVEVIVKEPAQFHYAVYFEAESGARILDGLPLLREAGRRLKAYPDTRLVVRGYADSSEGQLTVSAARVWYCTEYLKREYGISEERIRLAFFGAGEMSPGNAGLNVRRRVELFPEPTGESAPEEPFLRPSAEISVGGDAGNWTIPMQHTVYFEAESGTRMLDLSRLREAGRLLQADYRTRITLRGYAAPAGTSGGQIARSAARVWSCAEYLKREYGISERRIRMAFFGAEGMSEAENAEWNLRRCVEIIVEEPKPERRQYAVYFEAESGIRILESSLPLLRAAGERLWAYPKTNITLRGYSAPAGMEEGQRVISAARVWFCAEYLMREYGVPESRIRMAFFGADETPLSGTAELNRYRRVDITVEQD